MRTQRLTGENQNFPQIDCWPRRSARVRYVAVAVALITSVSALSSQALACGEEGGGQSISGSESAEFARRMQEETVEKAKAGAGLASIPIFAGVSGSVSHLEHDGFKLKTPVDVKSDCATVNTIKKLAAFETDTQSVSALVELDLSRAFGMSRGSLFKVGAAIGGKRLESETGD